MMSLIDPSSPDGAKTGVGLADDASGAQQLSRKLSIPVESLDARTPTSSTFALPDRSWLKESSFAPAWVWDADGTGSGWSRADQSVVANADGTLRPVAQPDGLRFSAGGADAVVLSGSVPDSTVTYEYRWSGGDLPAAVVDGARVTYPRIAPGVDLVFEVRPDNCEQYFVVDDATAAASLDDLPLTLVFSGGTVAPAANGDGFDVLNEEGAIIGHSPDPIAWDHIDDLGFGNPVTMPWMDSPRAGMYDALLATLTGAAKDDLEAQYAAHGGDPEFVSRQVTVDREVRGGSSVDASFDLPASWIDDPATSYPIVVDPVLSPTVYPSLDTWVEYGWTSNQINSTELKAGSVMSGSTHYIARTYIKWNATGFQGLDVTSAVLYLWDFHAAACASGHPLILRRTDEWTSTYLKYGGYEPGGWSAISASMQDYHGDLCGGAGWDTMDVSELVKEFEREEPTHQYIRLEALSNSDLHNWRRFNSKEASSHQPYFRIVYNARPDVPTDVEVEGVALDASFDHAAVSRPTLSATVTDADGGDVWALFTIRQDGIVVVDGLAGSKASGGSGTSSVDCPYALQPGVTYTIEVRASDGSLVSDATVPGIEFEGPPPSPSATPDDLPTTDDTNTTAYRPPTPTPTPTPTATVTP